MKFARCWSCGQMRALVPDKRQTKGKGSMLRTHYLGGAKRYAAKMASAAPHRFEIPMERCPGSQTSRKPIATLSDADAAG